MLLRVSKMLGQFALELLSPELWVKIRASVTNEMLQKNMIKQAQRYSIIQSIHFERAVSLLNRNIGFKPSYKQQ